MPNDITTHDMEDWLEQYGNYEFTIDDSAAPAVPPNVEFDGQGPCVLTWTPIYNEEYTYSIKGDDRDEAVMLMYQGMKELLKAGCDPDVAG